MPLAFDSMMIYDKNMKYTREQKTNVRIWRDVSLDNDYILNDIEESVILIYSALIWTKFTE